LWRTSRTIRRAWPWTQDCSGAAGFTEVRGERWESPLRYASADEACDAAFAGGPVALAYDRFPDEVRSAVRQEYAASIARYRDGAGCAIPGEFVVVAATR
jgi:hypothetical protein